MIKNGRPYTNENGHVDCDLIDTLAGEEIKTAICWVKTMLLPRKSVNNKHTSYGLKHIFSRQTGIYVTNNQFKDLMITCGYNPANKNELNWRFCISDLSFAFSRNSDYFWYLCCHMNFAGIGDEFKTKQKTAEIILRLGKKVTNRKIFCPCCCRDSSITQEHGEIWMNWDTLKIIFFGKDMCGNICDFSESLVTIKLDACPICGRQLPTNHRDTNTNGYKII